MSHHQTTRSRRVALLIAVIHLTAMTHTHVFRRTRSMSNTNNDPAAGTPARPSYYDARDRHTPPPPASGERYQPYLRRSAKNERQISLETQQDTIDRVVTGRDPQAIILPSLIDDNRPAGHGRRRPALEQLIAGAERGEFDAVVAYSVSRIGRDLGDAEELYRNLKRNDVRLISCDGIDLTTATMRGVSFGMAQDENDVRSRYAIENLIRRFEAGLCPTKSVAKFGLFWSGEVLQADAERLRWVERAHRWFVEEDLSKGAVARRLTENGVLTHRGRRHWDTKRITEMLGNPWYEGRVPQDGGSWFWDAGEAFIDPDLVRRARHKSELVAENHGGGYLGGERSEHPLAGLLFCGRCQGWKAMGSAPSSHRSRKDPSVKITYGRFTCNHSKAEMKEMCPRRNSVKALWAEQALLARVMSAIDGKRTAELRGEGSNAHAIRTFEGQVRGARRRQQDLIRRRERGEVLPDRWFNDEMTKMIAQEKSAEERLHRALMHRDAHMSNWERLVNGLERNGRITVRGWSELPDDRRRAFLRAAFPDGVLVSPAERRCDEVESRLIIRTYEQRLDAERRRQLYEAGEDGWERPGA